MKILAVDPGQTTGWALIENGAVVTFGAPKGEAEIFYWIGGLKKDADVFVIEDFRIRPGVNFSWAQLFPIQVIGALKFAAFLLETRVVIQQASIKPMAYKLINLEYKKGKKDTHIEDACAHGIYYWRTHGQKKTK